MEQTTGLSVEHREEVTSNGMIKHIVFFSATCLFPIIVRNNQYVLGTIINALLVSGAMKLKSRKEITLLCIMPSISALMTGTVLGTLTPFLAWMIPFIWLGNLSMCHVLNASKEMASRKMKAATIISAMGLKLLVVGIACVVLIEAGIMPSLLLPRFTTIQVMTVGCGSTVAGLIQVLHTLKCKKTG
ncbi:hypothetical protein GF325_04585 [Candidatus Bathyarchaeota archaeon]|nr:hypothetical protein [Candidatus Bathyarchaeota archaeon]